MRHFRHYRLRMWILEGRHSLSEPSPTPINSRRSRSHLGGESRSRPGDFPASRLPGGRRLSLQSPELHVPSNGHAGLQPFTTAVPLLGFLPQLHFPQGVGATSLL